MAKTEIAVAVIGAGFFAQFHHDAWRRNPNARLLGICDMDAEKATEAARRNACAAFTDVHTLISTGQPDLIDIATPPATHAALIEAAANAGIPVICQKPLAPTLEESEAIVRRAEEAGTVLVVHENFRFQPWYREIRRLIDNGWFGALHGVSFRLRPGDGQGPDAYLSRQPYFQQMPRFLIHETGIHFIDVFRYLMGEVTTVQANLRRINPVIAGEDAGIVLFDFENGGSGVFDGNRLNDHEAENARLTMGEMWLEGAAGVMRLDGDGGLHWKPHGGPEQRHDYEWNNVGFAGDCVFALQNHVIDHLIEGKSLSNTGAEYLKNIRIEEAVYESSRTGRRIALA